MRVALERRLYGRKIVILLATCFALIGCKSSSPTDLSSPESTLESFFKAVGESRIPDELNAFVLDRAQQSSWRQRCKNRGCKKVKYEIIEVEERGESGATLLVNYMVFGNNNLVVMQGKRSPIRFERIGSNWGITRFGRRSGVPPKASPPSIKVPPVNDAGSTMPQDATTIVP